MFPPEEAEKVLPILDRWTKIMRQVNGSAERDRFVDAGDPA